MVGTTDTQSRFAIVRVGLLSALLLAALVTPAAAEEPADLAAFWDEVVCTVDGSEISRRQVETEKAKLLPWTRFHGKVSAEDQMKLRRQALQSLIDAELQYQYAKNRKIKVRRKEVKREYEKLAKQYGGEKAFEKRLESSGASKKGVRAALERQLRITRAEEKAAASAPPVSDEEVRQYYEENRGTFQLPRQAVTRQILVYVPPLERDDEDWTRAVERAEALRRRYTAGESFESLVAEVAAEAEGSEGAQAKDGLLGVVHPGQLETPLDRALWSLDEGEMSEPIRAFKGVYLLSVDRFVAPRQLEYEELAERLEKHLRRTRERERVTAWKAELREQAEIEILDPQLGPQPEPEPVSDPGASPAP